MTIHDRGDEINMCVRNERASQKLPFRDTELDILTIVCSDRQTDRQTDDEKDRVFLPKEFDSCRAVKRASAPH